MTNLFHFYMIHKLILIFIIKVHYVYVDRKLMPHNIIEILKNRINSLANSMHINHKRSSCLPFNNQVDPVGCNNCGARITTSTKN